MRLIEQDIGLKLTIFFIFKILYSFVYDETWVFIENKYDQYIDNFD